MYRAIKLFNFGQEVAFRHFTTLDDAYTWLLPNNARQEEERWHIKLKYAVRREFDNDNVQTSIVTVGWNEEENNEIQYIQRVEMWSDALPRF
jgi:hypothetical protein